MFEPMSMSPSPSEKRKEKTMKSTTKIVSKLCRCGRIMENVPQQRVLCEVCRKEPPLPLCAGYRQAGLPSPGQVAALQEH